MIGVGRPLPELAGDLQAVAVGQAEVEQDHVGVPARGLGQPLAGGRRLHQAVVLRAQRGPEEAPHLRLVLDQEDERGGAVHGVAGSSSSPISAASASTVGGVPTIGMVKRKTRAATRAALDPDAPAVRGDDAPADGEAEPDAGARGAARPLELFEDPLLLAGRDPGPAVGHGHDDLLAVAAPLAVALSSIGVPGGVCLAAFSSRFTNTCSSRTSSTGTSGRSGGKSVVTGSSRQLVLHPDQRDAGDIRQELPLLLHLERAALDPDHVEQVRDQPAHPLGLLDDGRRPAPGGSPRRWGLPAGAAWSRRPRSRRAASACRARAS